MGYRKATLLYNCAKSAKHLQSECNKITRKKERKRERKRKKEREREKGEKERKGRKRVRKREE